MSPSLPEGWTHHELNGSVFYYHRTTNTVQQDPPSVPSTSAPPPAASAPPAIATPPQPQLQPQAPAVPPAAAPAATSLPPPPPPSGQAQVLSISQPQPTMQRLNVLVPSPGLQPGQQLAFTTPPGPGGVVPQRLAVAAQEPIAPGSTVTVQYPVYPATNYTFEAAPPSGPTVPLPSVDVTLAEDRSASVTGWWLYAAGWFCLCFCPPCGLLPWLFSTAWFFCKPRAERSRRPQQRTAACASLVTVLVLLAVGTLAVLGALAVEGVKWKIHHNRHGYKLGQSLSLLGKHFSHHPHFGPEHLATWSKWSKQSNWSNTMRYPEPEAKPTKAVADGSKPLYIVTWHNVDHAEGLIFANEADARAKFDTMHEGGWAVRIFTEADSGLELEEEYGAAAQFQWDMLARWAKDALAKERTQSPEGMKGKEAAQVII